MSNPDRRDTASPLEPDLDREGHGDITGKPKAGATGGGHARGAARSTDMREETATHGAAGATDRVIDQAEGEVRVPVVEERLQVGKREAELGAVEVRKTVTEEQQTVPVTLRQEEVRVEEVDTPDRPLRAGEDVFREGTIRVPVRGEEAVVAKEAVVTGEVVINKEQTTRQEQVADTVRREHVDVEENYRQARAALEQDFNTRAAGTGRTFAQAEPHYRAGFTAAHDSRHAGREFDEVEPELRRDYESRGATGASGATGDRWEQLREEIRTGWNQARKR